MCTRPAARPAVELHSDLSPERRLEREIAEEFEPEDIDPSEKCHHGVPFDEDCEACDDEIVTEDEDDE